MGFIGAINRIVGLFVDTFRQVGKGRLWLFLLSYFLIQWLVLYAHHRHLSPLFYPFVQVWVSLFSDQAETGFQHYPGHYLVLPYFFERARLLIGLFLEGLVLGATAMWFFDAFMETPRSDRMSLRLILPSWIHLALAWTLINGLMVVFSGLVSIWFEGWLEGSPRRQLLMYGVALPGSYAMILGLFYFTIPSIALFGDNAWQAIKRSLRMFARAPISCLFLAGVLLAVPVFMSVLDGQAGVLVSKFSPELVFWLLLAGLVTDVLVNFVWMGTAVRYLLDEDD